MAYMREESLGGYLAIIDFLQIIQVKNNSLILTAKKKDHCSL